MADLTFTDQNFEQEVLKSPVPVVIDFWAPWCAPCHIVTPIIDKLATDYTGKVKVGKLNVDENPQTAGRYGVMSIPTIMYFKNGQPVQSTVGAQGEAVYKQHIEQVLAA